MKKILLLSALLCLTFGSARAQISSMIISQRPDLPPHGRDFWFAEQSNDWGQDLGGKYMSIFITAPNNCTANVEAGGSLTPVPVTAYAISTFKVPEFWEMESSGEIENKGI